MAGGRSTKDEKMIHKTARALQRRRNRVAIP